MADVLLAGTLWICVALLVSTYFGYPLAMWARARHARPRRGERPADQPGAADAGAWLPRVDALLVIHNAATGLACKLDNLLALDYPPRRLHVHVACDGCTDASVAIARGYGDERVHVHAFPTRRGKSACLGDVLPLLDGEVVLFCDVRQRIAHDALRELLRALSGEHIGVVGGTLVFEDTGERGYARGVDAYWRYERFIRHQEAASGSVIGASGALYAARRALLPAVPPGLILDDLWIPLAIAARGARVTVADTARAFDRAESDPAVESARKRRTLAGNFQLIARDPRLLLPWTHPLGWRLWGHKWLRLLAPWLMALALLSSALLAPRSPLYLLLALLQLAFYPSPRWPGWCRRAGAGCRRAWPRPSCA